MGEGLSPQEVGKEIAEHAKHGSDQTAAERKDRLISITEAVLLSIVALLAAWSGYAAAKWSTESRVGLAKAAAARTEASRAALKANNIRNFDSSTFEAWFAAYTVHNEQAMALAEHRFRPQFDVAFKAWRATNPETNPNAPRGPTYMPQYHQPELRRPPRWTPRRTRPSRPARAPVRRPTNTSERPSSWRASSSSSASALTSRCAGSGTGWSGSAV